MATRLSGRLTQHLRLVETLASAGIPAPKEWTALRDGFDAYRQQEKPALQRLIAALITGAKTDDLITLHAQALAETAEPHREAMVHNPAGAAVENKLIDLYAPHAKKNYDQAASQFDSVAADFAAAAAAVDVEADPASMVTAPDDARAAWVAAEQHAARLDALLPVLVAAAELADLRINAQDGSLLALCADPGKLHRRRVWECWQSETGRTRRWGALVKLGARLRACDLDQHKPYEPPKPLERRQIPHPREHGIYREIVVDPEDADYQPAEPAPMGMVHGRMVAR